MDVKGVDKTCQWGVEGQHKCPARVFSINVTLLCRHCIRCLSSESRPGSPPWRTVGIHVLS